MVTVSNVVLMDIKIDPFDERERHGHNPVPCEAHRWNCPASPHCATCAKPIAEGYCPGFGGSAWTHDVPARHA